MTKAAAQDAAEDRQHGDDRRGDELPIGSPTKSGGLARDREAKAALEAEAQAAAGGQGEGEDSEAAHQIIVSCDLTNQGADSTQLLPLIDQIKANTEVLPKQVSAEMPAMPRTPI